MVFVSGELNDRDVFAREPDGTIVRLTEGFRGTDPAVDPEGRVIFSAWVNPDHNDEIYSMGADGSSPTRLTLDEPHGPGDDGPAVSPDGELIAFSREVVVAGSFFTDIYVMEIDGDNPEQLTESDGLYRSPSYSADGSQIVFSGYREGNSDIYIMKADGSEQRRLTSDAATDTDPVFGPDGRIVFSSDRHGSYDLYRMDADGENVTRLTSDPGAEFQPAFTGDGRLVFVSDRDGDLEIYLKGANDVWHALTQSDEPDYAPAF